MWFLQPAMKLENGAFTDLFEQNQKRIQDIILEYASKPQQKGAEDADKFTSQNITGVKVQWEPGQEFKNLRDDAEFNLVASRSAQAAVIKAIKEGKTNVDLNAPTTPDNTPGGSTPGGSNTGQTGSEGQGSESSGGTTGKDDTGDGLE